MLTYTNKKGKIVEVKPSFHAYNRFKQRYPKIIGGDISDKMLNSTFEDIFNQSHKVTKLNHKEIARLKKYGKDGLFFRYHDITFVVRNSIVITVEISGKGKRHLNKETA